MLADSTIFACECPKDKLKKAGISYEEVNPFEEKIESAEEYDLDQGNRIVNPPYITEKMAMRFFSMFWGREDVYARRGKNGGYFPQCANRWNDRLCPKQRKEKVFCDKSKSNTINLHVPFDNKGYTPITSDPSSFVPNK